MILEGNYTEDLKIKADHDITEIMQTLFQKDKKRVIKISSPGWFVRVFEIKPIYVTKDNYMEIPDFKYWDIVKIIFHSAFVIEVICKLDNVNYTFKMMAEKKAFKIDPSKPFRFIPDTFVRLLN